MTARQFGDFASVLLETWWAAVTTMAAWNWGEIAKVLVGVWAAVVATRALQTWRRQSKAQLQTKFMDDLTESVVEFCDQIKGPIELVRYVKISVESLAGLPEVDKRLENAEAIAYIKKHGKRDSERLQEYLKPCAEPLSKIHALLLKVRFLNLEITTNAGTHVQ